MAEEKFDFMVFGASGYTGQYVVEILAKTAKEQNVTWAVAGRHMDKIKKVLQFASSETGINLDHIKVLKADSSNYESLVEMCKVSKVILNCVGPYRWFGEPVVKACLETGAHHIDISGEAIFHEKMQLLYHDIAKQKKVYIIGACGFDSIPCEMGSVYLTEQFGKDSELNSIEQHIRTVRTGSGGGGGSGANHGTWDSAVNSFSTKYELADIRQKLRKIFYTKELPKPKFPLKSRGIISKNELTNKWSLLFPSPDQSIFSRTQKSKFIDYNERPCQLKSYITIPSIVHALALVTVGIIMGCLSPFKFTRNLLHRHPKFFSLGIFSKSGPTRQSVLNSGFQMRLIGEGWDKKLAEPTDQHSTPPNKKMSVMVKGPNAGYIATPIAMIQSGLMVLKQMANLPAEGGVYTPGIAFKNTTLIEDLNKNGVTFEVEK